MSWNPFSQAQQGYGMNNPQAAQNSNPWNNPQYQAQQMAQAQQSYQQMMSQGWRHESPRYMFDGKIMTFMELMNTLYPDDCAEKTMLVLKFKKDDE